MFYRKMHARPQTKCILLFFICFFQSQFILAKNCGLALAAYHGSLIDRTNTPLRTLLTEILLMYREGFRGKNESGTNENLKHVRRIVRVVRENANTLREHNIDPALLEVGIFLSDVAKNPALIEKYKKDYSNNAFATFLDHARLGLIEGLELKNKHKITDAEWNIIVEVVIGHDGPLSKGSWLADNFKDKVGRDYPELTPGSKYIYVHAMLDRMDQGGAYRDNLGVYQGGIRKISFDQLDIRLKSESSFTLVQTIEYALNHIHPGSRIQVDELINRQAEFFPQGIPLFLYNQVKAFDESNLLIERVRFDGPDVIFTNKKNVDITLYSNNDNTYSVKGSKVRMSAHEALKYFWDNL